MKGLIEQIADNVADKGRGREQKRQRRILAHRDHEILRHRPSPRLYLLPVLLCAAPVCAQTLDDSAAGRLRVFTDTYEVELSKSNGAILGITDKTAQASLTLGSRNGCLWGSNYQTMLVAYRGGCSFTATYSWSAENGRLTFTYNGSDVQATATFAFAPDTFDMQLTLANHVGATMQTVLFPSDLLFADNSIQAAYLPYYLPGVRLKPGFFTANRSISVTYPSARAFADFVGLESGGGSLFYFAVHPERTFAPAVFGFQDDERTKAGTFYTFHTFQTWVPDGETFTTPVIRVMPGRTAQEAIAAYRAGNGIAEYPSFFEKLSDRASAVSQAPLVKMDFRSIGRSFADLSARLDQIRAPAILHPVAYWPRAFDQNYPDFLPPDPRFGSMSDFRAFTDAAHARGLFVMPYTNPTWWDDQSPTVKSVPDIASLAVLALDGKPVYESYGPNRGFVSSPLSSSVQDRVAALMAQWREDVPVDFVFQDQIGSRSWLRDFNPAAQDPQSYSESWLARTRTYSPQNLMTEDGWDGLAATETGFAGSLLTGTTAWNPAAVRWGQGSRGNTAFGAGLWEPYPLGVWLFHDKVLFYHHDLDDLPMNAGPEVLTWNAAFGVMAGYFWPELRSPNPDWAGIAMAFQPAIMSRTAGSVLSSYRVQAPDVTESRFEDLTVIANWNAASNYEIDGYTIAPSGCLARTDDGAVAGGVFVEQFDGSPLSPGMHYLLVERTQSAIVVRQPSGIDTPVTVALPEDWDLSGGVQVRAITRANQVAGTVPVTLDDRRATFVWSKVLGLSVVERYEITR